MPVDPEYLRQHYASLSDEGLLEIDRADLVPAAQKCYDDELSRRKVPARVSTQIHHEEVDEEAEDDARVPSTGDKPKWFDDASEVFSRTDVPGATPATDVENALDALDAAGIPCYLDVTDIPEEEKSSTQPARVWRVLVPGDLNLHATSVLERDIFNIDFEAEWKAHLEMLSDEEVRDMNPREVFCGLFDRGERITRTYDAEIARRDRLKR
jgi:hypothetical protein